MMIGKYRCQKTFDILILIGKDKNRNTLAANLKLFRYERGIPVLVFNDGYFC